ncbi:MAG: hypothetical protein KBS35_02230 [Mycoplasma sp.]|nr:hypothetical protein [Candidatus Hennigella equi]
MKKILPCLSLPLLSIMPIISSCGCHKPEEKTLSFNPDITKEERDCGNYTKYIEQGSEIWFSYESIAIIGTTNFTIENISLEDMMITVTAFKIDDESYDLELAPAATDPHKESNTSFSFKIWPILIHSGTDTPTAAIETSWTATYTLSIKIDNQEFSYPNCCATGQFKYTPTN